MSLPVVLYTRPAAWQKYTSKKMKLVYCSIGGDDPRLRPGHPAGDSVGVCGSTEGIQDLINKFEEHKPDIYFHWTQYGEYTKAVMQKLKDISPKTLWVFGQGNQVLHHRIVDRWILENKEFVDVCLTNTTNPNRHKIMTDYGVPRTGVFYTFGFDPEVHTLPTEAPTYDTFFGGGDTVRHAGHNGKFPQSKFRHDFICAIAKMSKLHLRGGGTWPAEVGCQGGLHALEYFRAIQTAKVVLGTYHFDLERYYTKRSIYALCSGRMWATRYIPDMEKDFENGTNVIWFTDHNAGLELVKYYLEHDDEREWIAANGRKIAEEKHSWYARLKDFEKLLPWLLS
jgi:hypothetical protein